MKRILCLICALATALSLAACASKTEPIETAETPLLTAEVTPAPTDTPVPEETPLPPPALSPGAAEESRLSGAFAVDDTGAVLSATPGEDVSYLPRLLELEGSVAGFLLEGGDLYVVMKDGFYSLEPARLYRLPADGGVELISDEVSPAAAFCLAGDGLFFADYEDSRIRRYDTTTGEMSDTPVDGAAFVAADGGFIYYRKADGLYRNDSTMRAEARIGGTGVMALIARGDTLCVLAASDDLTAAAVGWLDGNGIVQAMVPLEETAESLLFDGVTTYVPQREAGVILALDTDGAELARLDLPVTGYYCTLLGVTADAVYYETLPEDGDAPVLVRLPLES